MNVNGGAETCLGTYLVISAQFPVRPQQTCLNRATGKRQRNCLKPYVEERIES